MTPPRRLSHAHPPTYAAHLGPHSAGKPPRRHALVTASAPLPRRRTPEGTAAPSSLAPRSAIPAHKQVPYLPLAVNHGPLKHQPRMDINLNGEATVPDTAAPGSGTVVVCRHLALSYIENRKFIDLHAQSKDDLEKFYTPEELKHLKQRYDQWRLSPPEAKQVVGNRQFGRWLAHMAREMDQKGVACAEALLLTPHHAMAVRIQHKSREGTPYIRISCYDPNGTYGGTGNHTALEVAQPHELRKHSMQDFFPDLSSYFDNSAVDAACVTAICPTVRLPKTRVPQFLSGHGGEGTPSPEDAAAFDAAVRRHIPGTLRAVCKSLAARGLTGRKALQWIGTLDNPLCRAVREGHPRTFASFAGALRRLGIHGTSALPALQAGSAPETSALHEAVVLGHTAAFIDFARALKRLGITGNEALTALLAHNDRGFPALMHAVCLEHRDPFVTFAKALKILGITGDPARRALLAPETDGTPTVEFVYDGENPAQTKDLQAALALVTESPAATEPRHEDFTRRGSLVPV